MIQKIFTDGAALAAHVADEIEALLRTKPDALLCIAAGHSSIGTFEELLRRERAGRLSFQEARFVAMDEWTGLPGDTPGAMGDFLRTHFLGHTRFREVTLFDGMAGPEAECARVEAYLKSRGGIDYVLFGLGPTGHVALNEPGVSADSRCHYAALPGLTARTANKYFPDGKPPVKLTGGVTIGVADALEAGHIALAVNTAGKREIVQKLIASAPSGALPASYLKLREDFELLLTAEAAG